MKLSIDIGQRRKLGEILLEENMISEEMLKAALAEQRLATGSPRLGTLLMDRGVISPQQFMRALSKQLTTIHRSIAARV